MSDEAAQQAQQMRTERPSDEAAAQNLERRQGIAQRAGVQIDRQRTEYVPQTQVGNLSIDRGRQVTDREEMGAGAQDRNAGAAVRQQRLASQLSRDRRQMGAGKTVGAMAGKGAPGGALGKGVSAVGGARAKAVMMAAETLQKGGFDKKEIQQTFGRGCVKMLWQNLWLTFGHSIYFLVVIFLASSQSRYARKWFPEIGEEWFPPDLIKKIPKAAMVPLKLAEILGLAFVLFWVLVLDLTCLGMFAFLLGIILTAKDFVS